MALNRASDEKDTKQLSVRLRADVIDDLKEIANEDGITATSALHKAISTEKFLRAQIKKGSKILIRDGDGTREIVFR